MTARRVGAAGGLLLAVLALLLWLPRRGYFWPRWVWFGLGTLALAAYLVVRVVRARPGPRRWLLADGALLAFLAPVDVVSWLMSGRGFFWPIYTIAPLSVVFGAHIWYLARRPDAREVELTERVDALTRTRRGAVDGQAAELRRIERDLHDGAQARMVSVALSIGIAESLVEKDPVQARRLLEDARVAATGAVHDLRNVMHGIYPPVLADRGLGGAVRALACDLVVPVEVSGDPPAAVPAALEAALYFAVAECLANAVKHGGADAAWVRFGARRDVVDVEVGDDGTGGATFGAGSGLAGIVDRLAAFDGTVDVHSPAGGPTRVRLRVPIAS